MNDTISNMSNIAEQTIETASAINIWMWIAFAELVFIIFLSTKIMKGKHNLSDKQRMKQETLDAEIDFNNIVKSSFLAQQLYDELKKKCHPDRFPLDADKNKIANEISQELAKNKRNHKRLLELKEQAKQQLNIHITE
jgi:hypothetical protein